MNQENFKYVTLKLNSKLNPNNIKNSIKFSDYLNSKENLQQCEILKNNQLLNQAISDLTSKGSIIGSINKIELIELITDKTFPDHIRLNFFDSNFKNDKITCPLKQSGTSKICNFNEENQERLFYFENPTYNFRDIQIELLNLDDTFFFNNENFFDKNKNYFELTIKVYYGYYDIKFIM